MKTKDKISNNKDKDKKIILWEVKSFQAIGIGKWIIIPAILRRHKTINLMAHSKREDTRFENYFLETHGS
jgi:hypothetical protein